MDSVTRVSEVAPNVARWYYRDDSMQLNWLHLQLNNVLFKPWPWKSIHLSLWPNKYFFMHSLLTARSVWPWLDLIIIIMLTALYNQPHDDCIVHGWWWSPSWLGMAMRMRDYAVHTDIREYANADENRIYIQISSVAGRQSPGEEVGRVALFQPPTKLVIA